MACLELHCACGYTHFTNTWERDCPQCGQQLATIFDEPTERDEIDDRDYEG